MRARYLSPVLPLGPEAWYLHCQTQQCCVGATWWSSPMTLSSGSRRASPSCNLARSIVPLVAACAAISKTLRRRFRAKTGAYRPAQFRFQEIVPNAFNANFFQIPTRTPHARKVTGQSSLRAGKYVYFRIPGPILRRVVCSSVSWHRRLPANASKIPCVACQVFFVLDIHTSES